jgi:hypothetical protein
MRRYRLVKSFLGEVTQPVNSIYITYSLGSTSKLKRTVIEKLTIFTGTIVAKPLSRKPQVSSACLFFQL